MTKPVRSRKGRVPSTFYFGYQISTPMDARETHACVPYWDLLPDIQRRGQSNPYLTCCVFVAIHNSLRSSTYPTPTSLPPADVPALLRIPSSVAGDRRQCQYAPRASVGLSSGQLASMRVEVSVRRTAVDATTIFTMRGKNDGMWSYDLWVTYSPAFPASFDLGFRGCKCLKDEEG